MRSFRIAGPWRTRALAALLLALPVAVAGWGPLFNETDGQYAAAARTMAAGGDWLIPENNGVPRLVKPPLLVWVMAASMRVFGANEFAARLPGAACMVLTAVAAGGIAGLWGGRRRALLAGAVVLTSLGAFTLGRIVMPEPMFTALLACAMWALALAVRSRDGARTGWVLAFWALAGLAAFAKGPHGAAYAVAAGFASLLCRRICSREAVWDLKPREFFLPAGILLAAAINIPWYLAVERQFPGFLHNLITVEHLGHLTGSDAPATGRGNVGRALFALLQLAWFLPWSAALAGCRREGLARLNPPRRWSFEAWLIAWWAGLVLASVLAAGQRQDYYAMAAWPPLGIAAARLLERADWKRATLATIAVFSAALAACLLAPWLAANRDTAALAERDTAFTTVAGLGSEVWTGLALIAIAGLGAGIAALVFLRPARHAIAAAAACLGLAAVAGTARVAPYFSAAPIAERILEAAGQRGRILFDGDVDTGSSLLFYTGRRIFLVGADPDTDFVVRTTGRGRANYLTQGDVRALWGGADPVVLVIDRAAAARWRSLLGTEHPPLASCGTTLVLVNHLPPAVAGEGD